MPFDHLIQSLCLSLGLVAALLPSAGQANCREKTDQSACNAEIEWTGPVAWNTKKNRCTRDGYKCIWKSPQKKGKWICMSFPSTFTRDYSPSQCKH